MPLESVFKHPAALRKYRCNPFFVLLDGYCRWLLDQGYARTSICGRIFHIRILTLFNTGARVQECVDVTLDSLRLDGQGQVTLLGKGRKERICPLWPETV